MTMPYQIGGPNEIATDKLLLWPNNPRLKISDFKEVRYTKEQLLEPTTQRTIYNLLSKHEDHDVATLVKSMTKSGFLREKAPVVMRVEKTDKYLVLEGNRRLTAIRTILADKKSEISQQNRRSLERIPCWIFKHTSQTVPLQAAISRMVAEAHIKGQRPHTKLQRAHMLYDAYEGFLSEKSKSKVFAIDSDALKATAEFFDFPLKELEGEISVVRLYKQVVEAYEFDDIPKKCSERLSWVHKHQRLFRSHFNYDPKTMAFDEPGLECYYDIFLHPEAAVYNPQTFRKFLNVMRYGGPEDIETVRTVTDALSDVERRIKENRSDSRFLIALQGIERKLISLRPSDFNSTPEELESITRIVSIVKTKLAKLCHTDVDGIPSASEPTVRFKKPKNIQEAIELDYSHLVNQVKSLVRSRPNATCVRSKIPTLLLKRWGVRSRGAPRDAFCARLNEQITKMIEEGSISSYKAKNERIRA